MKTVFRWLAILLGSLLAVILIGLGVIYFLSDRALNADYDIEPAALVIPEADSVIIADGERLVNVRSCTGCHGAALSGEVMIDEFPMGRISASNLTSGEGGIAGRYTDDDWVRAIRHAVGPDGKPLMVMPSMEFVHLGRDDLATIISYIKQLPPVDWTPPENSVGPLARALYILTPGFPLLETDRIDHSLGLKDAPSMGVTPEYGEYMAVSCIGCHGEDYAGKPSGPPGVPPSANLTALKDWSEEDFFRAVRDGVRPTGDTLHTFMPRWTAVTDTELAAVWSFLGTLEPVSKP